MKSHFQYLFTDFSINETHCFDPVLYAAVIKRFRDLQFDSVLPFSALNQFIFKTEKFQFINLFSINWLIMINNFYFGLKTSLIE